MTGIADKLQRLVGLVEAGILTREQFEQQKAQLLASSDPEAPLTPPAPAGLPDESPESLSEAGSPPSSAVPPLRSTVPEFGDRPDLPGA